MRYYLLSVFCFMVLSVSAQNLVPNESFETYNNCPMNLGGISYSEGYSGFPVVYNWTNPMKFSSPDYFNGCAIQSLGLSVPSTSLGYQQAKSGDAYAGIIAWQAVNQGGNFNYDYREYIQNKLSQPLKAGRQYCVKFFVSPTISAAYNFNYVAIDEIGLNFSKNRPVDTQNKSLALQYHIKNKTGNFLVDTSKWYPITGTYTAAGGEEWLTIGCFNNNNAAPVIQSLYPSVPNNNILFWSYLFVDEVSVIELTSADTVKRVMDTTICASSGWSILLDGAPGAVSRAWNNGDTATQLIAFDTGTYWCVSYMECGLSIDTFHIRYRPFKKLDLGKDIVECNNMPVTIFANNAYQSYLWSNADTTSSIIVNQTGSFTLTVMDKCGRQKDTIHINIQPPTPAPIVSDTTICQNTYLPKLNVIGADLLWYTVASPNFGLPFQPEIFTAQPGKQVVYVSQTIGKCPSPKVPVNIEIKYKPDAEIGDFISVCPDSDTLIGKPYPDVFYLWNTGEQVCCIKPRWQGTYQLMISNDCGVSIDTMFVEMSACDECLLMPNAFSPNSDGRNDVFMPIVKCPVTDYRMQIYNRWGMCVFSTENVHSGWNGRLNGEKVDNGVYGYMLEYRSVITGSRKQMKGNVSVLR